MKSLLWLLLLLVIPYWWVGRKFVGGSAGVIFLLGLGLFIGTLIVAIFGSTPVKPV